MQKTSEGRGTNSSSPSSFRLTKPYNYKNPTSCIYITNSYNASSPDPIITYPILQGINPGVLSAVVSYLQHIFPLSYPSLWFTGQRTIINLVPIYRAWQRTYWNCIPGIPQSTHSLTYQCKNKIWTFQFVRGFP